jgi:hypothetical protein
MSGEATSGLQVAAKAEGIFNDVKKPGTNTKVTSSFRRARTTLIATDSWATCSSK